MNKILLTLGALTIAVLTAGQAEANGPHATSHYGHGSYGRPSYVNYHVNHGVRFSGGYYYRGRSHYHWSYQRFDARYGCTCYFDPCCSTWYYWCQPAGCYYPVSYCPYRTYVFSGGCSQGGIVIPSGPVGPVGPGTGPVGPGVGPGTGNVPPMPPVGPTGAPGGSVPPGNGPPIPAPQST